MVQSINFKQNPYTAPARAEVPRFRTMHGDVKSYLNIKKPEKAPKKNGDKMGVLLFLAGLVASGIYIAKTGKAGLFF